MNIRFLIALYAAKLSIPLLKITKHNGTDFPGHLAIKICPNFLKYIDKPKEIVAVTGTDGKTTVTNLCYDVLKNTNKKILSNRFGSNINSGIATILVKGVNLLNKTQYDMAVLEVDERSSRRIYPYVVPDYCIVPNLFRDSIMRNGHPEYIRDFITSAMPKTTKLILNADDLLSCEIAPSNERIYYAIDKVKADTKECINLLNDKQICSNCHSLLKYKYRHYHHIGKAYCEKCGFKSPEPNFLATKVENNTALIIHNKEKVQYKLISEKLFDLYNMLCAITIANEYGLKMEDTSKYFNNIQVTETRYNETNVNGCLIIMQMCKDKNALACSRIFDFLGHSKDDMELFMMMSNRNDEEEWSENTCWMYDCDFEFLQNDAIKHVVVCGARVKDFRLRLNLAGFPDNKIECVFDEIESVKSLQLKKGTKVYILYGAAPGDIDYAFAMKERIVNRAKEITK